MSLSQNISGLQGSPNSKVVVAVPLLGAERRTAGQSLPVLVLYGPILLLVAERPRLPGSALYCTPPLLLCFSGNYRWLRSSLDVEKSFSNGHISKRSESSLSRIDLDLLGAKVKAERVEP